ncbi:MAG: c-type cytochrome domain-containing protein, partial [Fimbriimonadaceae bacterium]
MLSKSWMLLASLGGLTLAALSNNQKSGPQAVVFGRDILPILSDKCFKCHGPDAGSRMADLRLDNSEGAFANRGGRFAIVPGKPASSLLVERINHKDSPMPPLASGKSLTEAERTLIAKWIEQGAKYGKLWSFEPLPKSVPVPKVAGNWPKDDLDRFILDRLNREKLKPCPAAPRERWLRRVSLDLT